MEANKTKRKAISKKTRFEVFKRDCFTCQYCGARSPEVILHIDHIIPVSKGGTNKMTNLITACFDCNSGKSSIELDDKTAVSKANKQAELLQQRREQIELLSKWHMEIEAQKDLEVEALNDLYRKLHNSEYELSDYGKKQARTLIKKFGLSLVLECLIEANDVYKDPTKAFDKTGAFCVGKKNPEIKDRAYCIGILRNKLKYNQNQIFKLINFLDDMNNNTGIMYCDLIIFCKNLKDGSVAQLLKQMEEFYES